MGAAVIDPVQGDGVAGLCEGASVCRRRGCWGRRRWRRRWRRRRTSHASVEVGEATNGSSAPTGAIASAEQPSWGRDEHAHTVTSARSWIPRQCLPGGRVVRNDLLAKDSLWLELSGVAIRPATVVCPDRTRPWVARLWPFDPAEVPTRVDGGVTYRNGVYRIEVA